MDSLFQTIIKYKEVAPAVSFGLFLLAGCGIPISIDVLILINALLAATLIPESTFSLFFASLLGTYFSAWIPYWVGRIFGPYLKKFPLFSKLFSDEKLKKLKNFYTKHGLSTLVVGRFIPFGVRNCLFLTTGMSKFSFLKFALRDTLACSLWVTTAFFAFYFVGTSFEVLLGHLKIFNIIIFSLFGVAGITLLWYKVKKKKKMVKIAVKNEDSELPPSTN